MRYYFLYLMALIRGKLWKWPHRPNVPADYSAVSCGLRRSEVAGMWEYGWEPWCFQRTTYGTARLFRVKRPNEEIAWEASR
jgi:hypothetical protein